MPSVNSDWSIAIFAARETTSVLADTVRAAVIASSGRRATIDVLINGNKDLALAFSAAVEAISPDECILRVWSIEAPDKAHTWNEYVHRIWDTGRTAFFIDGYARVKPKALAAIEGRLASTPDALAGTGVPTCGRSAKRLREQMLRGGGIHGNLYAVTVDGMNMLREKGFRFPVGLYRTDPMLGSALACRLDPANNQRRRGTVVVAEATWDVDGISKITYKNVIGYFKRRLRQAQGVLESLAVREHMAINRLPPQSLPGTAQEMVNNWLMAQPDQARSLFWKQPSCLYAARQLRAPRDWEKTQILPVLLRTHGDERQSAIDGLTTGPSTFDQGSKHKVSDSTYVTLDEELSGAAI